MPRQEARTETLLYATPLAGAGAMPESGAIAGGAEAVRRRDGVAFEEVEKGFAWAGSQ
jgi:hypothetical protein